MKSLSILLALLTLSIACNPVSEQVPSQNPEKEIQPNETTPENTGK